MSTCGDHRNGEAHEQQGNWVSTQLLALQIRTTSPSIAPTSVCKRARLLMNCLLEDKQQVGSCITYFGLSVEVLSFHSQNDNGRNPKWDQFLVLFFFNCKFVAFLLFILSTLLLFNFLGWKIRPSKLHCTRLRRLFLTGFAIRPAARRAQEDRHFFSCGVLCPWVYVCSGAAFVAATSCLPKSKPGSLSYRHRNLFIWLPRPNFPKKEKKEKVFVR